jgi:hypothetical protein
MWNQHLLQVLREYETDHNEHLPHRSLQQALPVAGSGRRFTRTPVDGRYGGAGFE